MSPESTSAVAPAVATKPAPALSYDAFVSYSHRDTAVATGIQKGLHRIGRRVGQLHALRVFRDSTDLSANPNLWDSVAEALDRSRYLVVVLSPHAKASPWVDREISYWIAQRGIDHILIVLVEGQLTFDHQARCFDDDRSDAAAPALTRPGVLTGEPLYVDVSADAPWDLHNPVFRDKVTELAAPIHGKPKYELASEDLREQRKFRRLRRAAIVGLTVLTIAALVAGLIAAVQWRKATQQRNQAVARSLIAESAGLLSDWRSGDDVRALQQLLAANALNPEAARGALFDAVIARRPMRAITAAVANIDQAKSAAFSRDGRLMIRGDRDGTVQVFDTATGQPVGMSMASDGKPVEHVALSPNGQRAAGVGFAEGQWDLRVWDVSTGRASAPALAGHATGSPQAVAITDGGQVVLVDNTTVRAWQVQNAATTSRSIAVGEDAPLVTISGDGQRVAALGRNGMLRVWQIAAATAVGQPIPVGEQGISSMLRLSFDGQRVMFTTDARQTITRVWDVTTSRPIGPPITDTGVVAGLAFSTDGQRVTMNTERGLGIWIPETAKREGDLMVGYPNAALVAFSSDSQLVALHDDGTFRSWDSSVTQPMTDQTAVAISADGQRVATRTEDSNVRVWDLSTRRQIGPPISCDPNDLSVALSPGGHRIACGDGTRTWRVRQVDTGADELTLSASDQPPTGMVSPRAFSSQGMAFSQDGHRFAAVARDGIVRVWDLTSGALTGPPVRTDQPECTTALTDDGRRVICAGWDSETHVWGIRMWSVENGTSTALPIPVEETVMPVSQDGRHVLTYDTNRIVRVRDIRTGEQIGEQIDAAPRDLDPQMGTGRVSFSADDTFMIYGDRLGSEVRLWDLRSGKQLGHPLTTDPLGLDVLAFSSDGRRFVTGNLRGVWVWPGPQSWPQDLCAKIPANMTRQQWSAWVSPDIAYQGPLCTLDGSSQ